MIGCQPEPPEARTETLEKLKKALSESQLEDKLLSTRIGELEKRVGEADKIVAEYKKAFDELKGQHQHFSDYYGTKYDMITKIIPAPTQALIRETVINVVDKEISDAQGEVVKYEGEVTTAQANVVTKQTEHDSAASGFEALKAMQKALTDGFKTLTGLEQDIEELDTGTNNNIMFFLITDLFKQNWSGDRIPGIGEPLEKLPDFPVAEIEKLVESAWDKLDAAKEALNLEQKKLMIAKEALSAAIAKHGELKAGRRQKIIEGIENMPDPCAKEDNTTDPE